jgi:hypothetical protein
MALSRIARTGCLALALAAGLVTHTGAVPSAYAAEKDDLSKARAKFQQATELEQAGNHANALQLFREVGQVRMTPQVRFHIATCEEKLGKLVAALGGYELALAEAESLGPEFQKEVEERTASLRGRIPKLVIERGEGAETATIELDGVSLGSSSIGVEVPIDPGPHAIQAKSPGHKPYSSTIEMSEQQVEKITVSLEDLPVDETPVADPKDAVTVPATPTHRPSRIIPYAIGGFGAAALVTSGVFFILQRGKDSELETLCGTDRDCTNTEPRALNLDQQANARSMNKKLKAYSTTTQISAVAGVVALGVAGVLILTEPKQAKPATAWSIEPHAPGAQLGGLSVIGRF